MLKIAIIGCGKIADDHAEQIRRIQRERDCRIVATCDREALMARQLAERFQIERYFSDAREMLKESAPDVVHITTPPQSHHPLGKLCLEHGCHVYIEKPFTVNAAEAEELLHLSNQNGLKVTAGHDLQFSHAARRLRHLVKNNYLGDGVLHMESYYCYDLSDPRYAQAFLANDQHWLRNLPGMLLHNIISHGIARIAEHLTTDYPEVVAHGFVSPMLRGFGEEKMIDELRVMITEERRTTAYFTFSSQMRPSLNLFRIFGPANGLELDQEHETVIKLRGQRFVSYADKFIPPVVFAGQQLANIGANLRRFAVNDFHMKAGMKFLIESFYDSITANTPAPISEREILLVTRIMDSIFEQLNRETGADRRLGVGRYSSSNVPSAAGRLCQATE